MQHPSFIKPKSEYKNMYKIIEDSNPRQIARNDEVHPPLESSLNDRDWRSYYWLSSTSIYVCLR